MSDTAFNRLIELFDSTHRNLQHHAARSVDATLVVRNWLFGFYIVEFENGASDRATMYGKQLISSLAGRLKEKGIKGASATNLKLCRSFYSAYCDNGQTLPDQSVSTPEFSVGIRQTLSDLFSGDGEQLIKDASLQMRKLASRFQLGWSHYVCLLTLSDQNERKFYEIEASSNSWSVREMERQIRSGLYNFYRNVKLDDEAPTIGIVLCKRKNDALVELTLPSNSNIYASAYKLYLPTKEELTQKLNDWSEEIL